MRGLPGLEPSLSAGPGGGVEIVNSNGPIEVVAGPAGAVDITAVLEARAMTEARAKEILSEITIEETVKPDHVRVATVTARSGRGGFEVSYKVTVPADARLEMTGNNSRLKAEVCGGMSRPGRERRRRAGSDAGNHRRGRSQCVGVGEDG